MSTPEYRPDIEAVIPEFESRRPLTQERIDRPPPRPASIRALTEGEVETEDLDTPRPGADHWDELGTALAVAMLVLAIAALLWVALWR